MDQSLVGTVLLGVAFFPWIVEVLWQVRLQPRVLASLPEATRATLPPHPRRPWLVLASSARFQLAFWRLARREDPDDSPMVRELKRQVRASLHRELIWAFAGLGTLVALLARGWRPGWL